MKVALAWLSLLCCGVHISTHFRKSGSAGRFPPGGFVSPLIAGGHVSVPPLGRVASAFGAPLPVLLCRVSEHTPAVHVPQLCAAFAAGGLAGVPFLQSVASACCSVWVRIPRIALQCAHLACEFPGAVRSPRSSSLVFFLGTALWAVWRCSGCCPHSRH